MGHIVNAKEEVYRALAERLNRNPIGTPINESLMEILHRLYTESEAMAGSKFPMVPMTLDKIANITGMKEDVLLNTLDDMANKGLVIDLPRREGTYYLLAPMLIGFWEYTFMRVRDEINMKELAKLFNNYFQDPALGRELIGSNTKLFKTLVYESIIPAVVETEVLDYERASVIIRQSGGGSLSLCACRHMASHQGTACEAPIDTCTSLGYMAEWVVRRGMGRPATVDELLRVLDQTEKLGLVHLGDNVLNESVYICHCCSCCCTALRATREYGLFNTHPSNFIPALNVDECTACGICAEKCPVRAIGMYEAGGGGVQPEINQLRCIGCGVCASVCPNGAVSMSRRPVLHVPPENKIEQLTRISKEKGKI